MTEDEAFKAELYDILHAWAMKQPERPDCDNCRYKKGYQRQKRKALSKSSERSRVKGLHRTADALNLQLQINDLIRRIEQLEQGDPEEDA